MAEVSFSVGAVLDAWFSQKPTVALMGEFSAGKSTLLNLLLGGEVLPTQVTATNMPVIWMTYAEEQSAFGLSHDGVLHECDMKTFTQDNQQEYLLLQLAMPIEILKRIDVIDTPGISDPRLALDALKFLGPYLDFVVWCTAANQAWRQTEKAMWTSMPPSLRATSILALTRADTLKKSADLEKVRRRCIREADGLFGDYAPIAALAALAARSDDGEVIDPSSWTKSHADTFMMSLEKAITLAVDACTARATIAGSAAEKAPATKPAKEKKQQLAAPAKRAAKSTGAPKSTGKEAISRKKKTVYLSDTSDLINAISALRQSEVVSSSNDQFFDTIEHLFNTFVGEKQLSEAHQSVLGRMVLLDRSDNVSKDGVLAQLERELKDFKESAWCALDQIH